MGERLRLKPGFDIASADPATIYAVLERLVCDPEERARRGAASVPYVAQVHEMHRVAEQVLRKAECPVLTVKVPQTAARLATAGVSGTTMG